MRLKLLFSVKPEAKDVFSRGIDAATSRPTSSTGFCRTSLSFRMASPKASWALRHRACTKRSSNLLGVNRWRIWTPTTAARTSPCLHEHASRDSHCASTSRHCKKTSVRYGHTSGPLTPKATVKGVYKPLFDAFPDASVNTDAMYVEGDVLWRVGFSGADTGTFQGIVRVVVPLPFPTHHPALPQAQMCEAVAGGRFRRHDDPDRRGGAPSCPFFAWPTASRRSYSPPERDCDRDRRIAAY